MPRQSKEKKVINGVGTGRRPAPARATIGFNSSGQLSVTPNYYGKPLGPSGGIDFKNNQLTYGNYQNGFFNMQSVSFNGELQKAVTIAELNAYKEYWSNITNWTVKVDIAKEMTLDWIKGSGNVVRTIDNDRVTDELKDAPGVNKARDFFYNKYKEVENLKGASVTNYSSGFFGPKGAYDAGLNPIRQFIGGYSVNINSDGEYLYFSVYNRTSFKSLLFDIGPQWERTSFGPMGNMYQYYKWTEQVEKYRYKIK